jgi:hypothetical protein
MASSASAQGKATANQARTSAPLEVGMRIGLAAYALVHLLIAGIALQVAWSSGGGQADTDGALRAVADEPLGTTLLWAVVVGMVALVIWQLLDAAVGHTKHDGMTRVRKRVGSAGKAVVYGVLAYQAGSIAAGSSSGGGSRSEESTTAKIMNLTGGQLLVGAIGVAVVGVGVALAVKGVTCRFTDDLRGPATSGTSGSVVLTLGQVGYVAKGIALAVVGGLFVWAAATHDPDKAGGLDEALKTLLEQPFGSWLLSVVALGIAAFGVYCIAWARWPDPTS